MFGFLAKLHDYLEHRSQHVLPGTDRNAWRSTADLNVRIHPSINIATDAFEAAFPRLQQVCVASPRTTLVKSIWPAMSPTSNTMIMCDAHVESNDSAILAWHRRTYEFRATLSAMAMP